MAIIGIDLGTTNSLVSVWKDAKATIIPNVMGSNLTPSVVSLDENGDILVGQAAKERLITHPNATAAHFKRHMGTKKKIDLADRSFLPEDLSSFILRSLKADAEAYLGETVNEAVISVPAYFNDAQRKATQTAGHLAGLQVERLINEPTAAAIAYGLHEEEKTFLVFDLGGGTFDVSVLELFDGIMEVNATAGDNTLGGEDFTSLLINGFLSHHSLQKTSFNKKQTNKLHQQAESAKCSLTRYNTAELTLEIDGQVLHWNINNELFEQSAQPLLARLRLPVERALNDASFKPSDLSSVILVGGATRMPLIRKLASRMFGHFPTCHLNPDEVVSKGTAIQAGLKSRDKTLQEVVLTDVCPYTLGTDIVVSNAHGVESGHFKPIIERNTVVPVSKVERFYSCHDNQEKIDVGIFQGESRRTKDNIELGAIYIDIPKGPAGSEAIDVRYTYDINGILEVIVNVISTKETRTEIIEGYPGKLSKAEIDARMEQLAELKIHPREQMKNRTLIARGERLYEESLGDTRQYIARLLADFESIIEHQDANEIGKAWADIEKHFCHIESERL